MAIIERIEYFLPESVISNDDLAKLTTRFSSEKIKAKLGVSNRHIAGEDETALDLAFEAAQLVLKDADPQSIDFLLLCTQSPDYFLPTSACVLHEKLGLRSDAGALDFNLGCSGYVYGLALAKSLIHAKMASKVLLITSETYSKHIHPQDIPNRTIFGDGAAATLVVDSPEPGIREFAFGTDGTGKNNLIVPAGGFRKRFDPEAPADFDDNGVLRSDNHLYMNGPEIFNFTIKAVPIVFEQTLTKNGLAIEDIDWFVFHQANKHMLKYLRTICNIPEEKFIIDMEETGNTVSATIPIALSRMYREGQLKKGQRAMILGFGVGYSWGGGIIDF